MYVYVYIFLYYIMFIYIYYMHTSETHLQVVLVTPMFEHPLCIISQNFPSQVVGHKGLRLRAMALFRTLGRNYIAADAVVPP